MAIWHQRIQEIIDTIDYCIKNHSDEQLTLSCLSKKLGYSEYHMTRKFKELSGMQFRNYLRLRKLAFVLKEVRDSKKSFLDIAITYGFSSHEAFTRAFKRAYGITPSLYRKNPKPIILRTKITLFNRYLFGSEEMGMMKSNNAIKIYVVTIPAHKFLHIKNYESNGYWDFWQKQKLILNADMETICGLLDSIKGKLDDTGGSESHSESGQLMAYMNDPNGRLCDWNYLRSECYGVRLPINYKGNVPSQMLMADIPEAEYIVFEHGPFNYDQEKQSVEEAIENEMSTFDFEKNGYEPDMKEGRLLYFYFDPKRFWKYVRPVRKLSCMAKENKDEKMV